MQTQFPRRKVLLGLSGVIFSAPLFGAASRQSKARAAKKKACAKLKRRIRRIESRMRAGYRAKSGRRYRRQLRELNEARYRRC